MRILLVQDALYLPSFGGGNKSNRLLLEDLARRGHRCEAIARGLNRSVHLHTWDEVLAALAARGVEPRPTRPGGALDEGATYRYEGVTVWTADLAAGRGAALIRERVRALRPDWVLVSDDGGGELLEAALDATDRVVALIHTLFQLPFGPMSARPDPARAGKLGETRARLAVSRFVQRYLLEHGGLSSEVVHLPVFGRGPFEPNPAPEAGWVMQVNPCPLKGSAIFLGLARRFPEARFAAVPTWGADAEARGALERVPGLRLLPPDDDIGVLLRQARVLIASSLVPETFGYVIVEAMLRGVPVLASDLGGTPEARLGVDYLLPVRPASFGAGGLEIPEQDLGPWEHALGALLGDPVTYDRVSRAGVEAATRFLEETERRGVLPALAALGGA